jgi:uncharacterized protein (DUF934 family)
VHKDAQNRFYAKTKDEEQPPDELLSILLLDSFQQNSNSLTAANTRRANCVFLLTTDKLVSQVSSDASAGCSQRMSQSNCASVHVQFVAVDFELLLDGEGLSSEGFIHLKNCGYSNISKQTYLNQIDVVQSELVLLQQASNGVDRPDSHD